MVPNWYGVNDQRSRRPRPWPASDYVVLLVDMYGRGLRPANPDEAGKAAGGVYADPAGMRGAINAALARCARRQARHRWT